MNPDRNTEKIALLVGIDEYKEVSWNELRGCKNDVQLMQDLLIKRYGFLSEHVRVLVDAEATQQGIRDAMARVTSQVRPGAVVVFFYAGHGSQLMDPDDMNPTGWEQTLVPHDSGRGAAINRDISDTEIRAWVRELERLTPYVTLIFDCCHSGAKTRGDDAMELAGFRGVPAGRRSAASAPRSMQGAQAPARPKRLLDVLPRPDRYVVLSACADEERAAELSITEGGARRSHGAFSYHLGRALLQGGKERSYRDLFEVTATHVTTRFPTQHPRCEGALDRSIFGTEDLTVRPFVSVLSIGEGEVTLRGGALHGLTVGSEWALYSVEDVSAEPAPCAVVRVRSVSAGSAVATILSSTGPLKLPCRAWERERAGELHRWPVALAADPELAGLHPLLLRSPWLRPSTESESARATIVRVPQGPGAAEWGRPRTDALRSLAVRGHDQTPLLPLLPEAGVSAHALLIEELERLARCTWLRALCNPSSPLSSALEVKILLGPRWTPAPVDSAGRMVAPDGSLVALDLRNVSEDPVHVAALIVGGDRSITQIYPPPGAPTQRIEPGRRIRVGAWQLRLPDESVLPPGALVPHATSVDTLKIFATRQEIDLHPILQGTSLLGSGAGHPLRQRLSAGLAGERSRGASPEDEGDASDWACIGMDVLISAASH